MAETILNFVLLLVVVGFAVYESSSGNIAMTVYACALLVLYSLLWKLDLIEKRTQRICELLEGEDNGEDPETEGDESEMLEKGKIYLVVENGVEVVKLEHVFSGDSDLENPNPEGNEGEGDDGED
jgi:hypothetical protein